MGGLLNGARDAGSLILREQFGEAFGFYGALRHQVLRFAGIFGEVVEAGALGCCAFLFVRIPAVGSGEAWDVFESAVADGE
ncbi:MAG: hypothetical protein ACK55I_12340, partial [bacterium]